MRSNSLSAFNWYTIDCDWFDPEPMVSESVSTPRTCDTQLAREVLCNAFESHDWDAFSPVFTMISCWSNLQEARLAPNVRTHTFKWLCRLLKVNWRIIERQLSRSSSILITSLLRNIIDNQRILHEIQYFFVLNIHSFKPRASFNWMHSMICWHAFICKHDSMWFMLHVLPFLHMDRDVHGFYILIIMHFNK